VLWSYFLKKMITQKSWKKCYQTQPGNTQKNSFSVRYCIHSFKNWEYYRFAQISCKLVANFLQISCKLVANKSNFLGRKKPMQQQNLFPKWMVVNFVIQPNPLHYGSVPYTTRS
jgi:hypothetical protein